MKLYLKPTIVTLLIAALGLTSCVQPTGTPAQQARQTEANAQVINAVGMTLLGAGAATLGAAALNNSVRGRYYYGGGYYNYRAWRNGGWYYY